MSFKLLFLALLAYVVRCRVEVAEIDDDNFREHYDGNEQLLILLYKSDTPNIDNILTEYANAYDIMAREGQKVVFGRVDADASPSTVSKLSDPKFPKLYLFINERQFNFEINFEAADIATYLRWKLESPSRIFSQADELEEFIRSKEVIVFFGGSNLEDKNYRIFINAARDIEDVIFANCGTQSCLNHFKVSNGSLWFMNIIKPEKVEFTEPFHEISITSFIRKHTSPIYEEFSAEVSQRIFRSWRVGIFLFRQKANLSHIKYEHTLKRVSKLVKGVIIPVVTEYNETDEQVQLISSMRIKPEDVPGLYIFDARDDEIFSYKLAKENITEREVVDFIFKFSTKQLSPLYTSEEPPVVQTHPVATLVGKTFNDYIKDVDKDILVLFYIIDCHHCDETALEFDKLATELIHFNKNLAFAKINCHTNEIPGLEIMRFPFIRLYPAGKKTSHKDYGSTNRTVEGFKQFLADFATHPVFGGDIPIEDGPKVEVTSSFVSLEELQAAMKDEM